MKRWQPVWRSLAMGLLLSMAVADARAADVLAGIPLGGFGSDLHAARDKVDLESGSSIVETTLTRFGLAISEGYGDYLALGLIGGYATASQKGQALTDGFDFTGPYAGVNLQTVLPLGHRFRIAATGQFVYQWLKDETDTQRVRLEWAQADAVLTAQLDVTSFLTLYAGPWYSNISVDQTARGTVSSTSDFDGHRSNGAVYGVQLEVDPRGWVSLEAHQGPMKGVAISFQRRF